MKVLDVLDLTVHEHDRVSDAYTTCKYIERKGVSLEEVTQGNVHDMIEEATDDNQLTIIQVVTENQIEGYLIE